MDDKRNNINNDQTLVITGGSSGIGLAICQRFSSAGYRVFNLDVQSSQVGHFIQVDVTDAQAVKQAIAHIADQHTITTLICNAGKHLSANIEQTDEATLDALIALNVKGAYHSIQACLPSMKAAHSGSILLIASEQAVVGKTNSFAYNLTKHALGSIAKTTALDYAAFNIRANALCPGTIDTPLYQQAVAKYVARSGVNIKDVHAHEARCQPLGRIGLPEEVAAYALFLASPEASFVTGTLPIIDGGYAAQ